MQAKKVSYIAIGLVPNKHAESIGTIRDSIGLPNVIPEFENGMLDTIGRPHLTIKRTFYPNKGVSEQQILDAMKHISFNPLEVIAKEWKVFDTGNLGKVLVLSLERTPTLVDLHNVFVAAVKDLTHAKNPDFEGDGFHPHISAIYHIPEERLNQSIQLLEQYLPMTFTLENVHFLSKDLSLSEDPKGPDMRKLVKVYKARK